VAAEVTKHYASVERAACTKVCLPHGPHTARSITWYPAPLACHARCSNTWLILQPGTHELQCMHASKALQYSAGHFRYETKAEPRALGRSTAHPSSASGKDPFSNSCHVVHTRSSSPENSALSSLNSPVAARTLHRGSPCFTCKISRLF